MCGIFFYCNDGTVVVDPAEVTAAVSTIAHRGPDASSTEEVTANNLTATLGFHRLAIVKNAHGGDSIHATEKNSGMQPMRLDAAGRWVLLCNGEIYNYDRLAKTYAAAEGAAMRSDVEVILWMLEEHDMEIVPLAYRLDGDFAFVALDTSSGEFVAARDPIGVRPLFYGISNSGVVAFASEAKALVGLKGVDAVRVFPPGHAYSSRTGRFDPYHHHYRHSQRDQNSEDAAAAVRTELVSAVRKRIEHGDVSETIGVLCSGGIDSAAITCLAQQILNDDAKGKKCMRVFTMRYREGRSDDAFFAGLLCAHLGVDHETIDFGPEDLGEDTISAVIRSCETCDPNTVRAAIPMHLLAKAIKDRAPEVKVVLSGEGADELFGGYNYFRFAPDASSASDECDRLLRNLHMFDLLRADRCFAAHGLEVRVPFLDPALIKCVRSECSCEQRVRGEKQLLRDAVAGIDALARFRILDRPKEKFSDGAGYTYVPDLLRKIAGQSEGGDDGTLETRLAAEKAFYKTIFDREFAGCPTRDAWVVERELPAWKEVEARRAGGGGGSLQAW